MENIAGTYLNQKREPHIIYHVCQLGWQDESPSSISPITPGQLREKHYIKIDPNEPTLEAESARFLSQKAAKFQKRNQKIPNPLKGLKLTLYPIK
jgi:hypothetical protein